MSTRSKTQLEEQFELPVTIEKEIEVDGVGMGVLSDGSPYLTGRGLARLCGSNNSQIVRIGAQWDDEVQPPRITKIKNILASRDIYLSSPYRDMDGTVVWTGDVCVAVLEYYAFEASNFDASNAIKNYRALAGEGFRDFVYTQVGYDPKNTIPNEWKQFHDRVSLVYNNIPAGYFSIFKEIADLVVTLGARGLKMDEKFLPDISVGIAWSKHWQSISDQYGQRIKYEHNYPDYFPQSKSNPQEPWCYPESALGEFRRWFREVYVGKGAFEKYIKGQVSKRALPPSFASLALSDITTADDAD